MTARRAALAVPASEPLKVEKAGASAADEIVVDLEDAVALALKDTARANTCAIGMNISVRLPSFIESCRASCVACTSA